MISAKNLYLPNGYLNMREIAWGTDSAFVLLAHGRGTGKTFGMLKMIVEDEIPSIYMRRTQSQHDFIINPNFSPFTPVNEALGRAVMPYRSSKFTADWRESEYDEEKGKFYPIPGKTACCISTSLSAMHNVRGIDTSDKTLLFYDEFIPEKHEKKITDEGGAFQNAYETLNRNRELQGLPPLKAVLCSNSNQLSNPIFEAFGLVDKAEEMKKRGQEIAVLPKKNVTLILPRKSVISDKKADTALYQATADQRFKGMALGNNFAYDTPTAVKSLNIKQYRPIAVYRGITVNKEKGTGYYYITKHVGGGCAKIYQETEADRIRFLRDHAKVLDAYIAGKVVFETYSTEIVFRQIFLEKN